jgi:hypothetical protein
MEFTFHGGVPGKSYTFAGTVQMPNALGAPFEYKPRWVRNVWSDGPHCNYFGQ